MSYMQMVSLSASMLRSPGPITPLGNECDIGKIGTPATIADAEKNAERIRQANAKAAAFIQKLEAIRDGDVLDVAPDELRAENLAIKLEAAGAIEQRIAVRERLQAEFADYKAQRKAELVAAQNDALPHVEALVPFPTMFGREKRDSLVSGAVTKEFAAYQWAPSNLFRHTDARDLALAKRALGIALLDAAGLAGSVVLPPQVVLPAV